LPFPALVKISERPIRTAVCGVYSLARITIIISILRAVLLGLNRDASLELISILTMIEVMTVVVVGCSQACRQPSRASTLITLLASRDPGRPLGNEKARVATGISYNLEQLMAVARGTLLSYFRVRIRQTL